MAEAFLEIVLENLNSLIQKELGLLSGFDQDMERLASLFTTIKATLADAEEKQFSDSSIKDWLQKLKDAVYVLDDILDECAYEALRLEYQGVKYGRSDKVQRSYLSSFNPKHVSRYKIAKKMKRISERLDKIAEERKKFHLPEMVLEKSNGVTEWRQTTSFITEPQVYGREEDKDKIVDFLVCDASHFEDLSVYSIVGLGGLGKTTLAQLIYNHERVVNHFELRIWVCVSDDFSLKRMIKAIIEATSGHVCENLDLEPLQRKLQDLLQSKRYLLVLDDVWDDEQENWQRLKFALACGAKGASILVTTRLAKVATIMGTIPAHELSGLSNNDCWELFKHRAFGQNEAEHAKLEVIGNEIVKKCGGVPLAAKALGGLLRFKREEKEWLHVKESSLWSLPHNENSIMPALRLSYLNLPVKLKQCFSYCAIFPKGHRIEKQYLIELWMANGFISSNGILDVEDVGDGVWNELYWRSFFQDIERDEFSKVTSFTMHDFIHDLAQFVSEEVCLITTDNVITTLSKQIYHFSDHRAVLSEVPIYQLRQVNSMRTCLLPWIFENDQILPLRLRILHWQPREESLSSIGHLKHLRYLNISGGDFKTLPESVCKLWNLQILNLDDCECLKKLPDNLICLKTLQRLSLNGCSSLSSLPPQIGKLTSLRILCKYFVGEENGFFLSELGALKLKGDLHIKHLGKVKSVMDAKEANMSSKQLNMLWLSWDKNEEECELQEDVEQILEVLKPDPRYLQSLKVEGYEGVNFSQWMSCPSFEYLTYLQLEDCERCLQLPVLGKLPSLKDLRICNMIHVKYLHEDPYDDVVVFMALEYLSLMKLPSLISLSKENGENMFPRLSTLEIVECPEFLAEQVLLQGLHFLKKLHISGCHEFNVPPSFHCLTCLEELSIGKCRKVEGLHEALQHMTTLKLLCLNSLPNLQSLPDCFENLPLLCKLSIYYCFELTCLPMSLSLSGLKTLSIWGCPELHKRCEKEMGEDWPKIAHIPEILVPSADTMISLVQLMLQMLPTTPASTM